MIADAVLTGIQLKPDCRPMVTATTADAEKICVRSFQRPIKPLPFMNF
jgi:hypothetical protein